MNCLARLLRSSVDEGDLFKLSLYESFYTPHSDYIHTSRASSLTGTMRHTGWLSAVGLAALTSAAEIVYVTDLRIYTLLVRCASIDLHGDVD